MSSKLFDLALAAEGVTGTLADVARSIYMQESGGGRNTKTSNAGAVGGMQIIPSTFAAVADKGWDINDPEQNARAGIRYLQQLHGKAGGDPALTAVGYYGGPGAMAKAREGVAVSDPRNPNAPNTLQYAQQVVGRIPKGGSIVPNPGAAPIPVAEAPVQLAQSVPMVQTPQGPVPVGYAAPDAGSWKEFQQAMADPITPASLDFGSAPKGFNPLAYAPQGGGEVNFRAFNAKRVRA